MTNPSILWFRVDLRLSDNPAFQKAIELVAGNVDQIEPDGLPNKNNIPLTTLHGNIWYHLGLAYYLKNDMKNPIIFIKLIF